MAETFVEVVQIGDVSPHPNADRLEVATVGGYSVVVGKGTFSAGDVAAYFPPNILLPSSLADDLSVTKYLKHAEFNQGEGSSQCRVAGCRLRGQPSFGFLASIDNLGVKRESLAVGQDISELIGTKKYEPPVRITTSDAASDNEHFHRYSEIENIQRHPNGIPEGTAVRITEKLHGSNCRIGIVNGEYMAGSNRLRRKEPPEGKQCIYWEPLTAEMRRTLLALGGRQNTVILFGEIYGPGVQDMDYGVPAGKRGFRVFDISINGQYVPWGGLKATCDQYGIETVPLLYAGPFSRAKVDELTYGPTTLGEPSCSFKGREGVVITPLTERWMGGRRMILKSVSADYLDRKGAEDNE
jgi:RNA ligase (TIGR02306 family)